MAPLRPPPLRQNTQNTTRTQHTITALQRATKISPHAHTPKLGAGPFDAHPQTIGNHCPKVFGQWIKL